MTTTTLTVSEVAERLRVSIDTVYRKIQSGDIVAVRVFGMYRISVDEVDRLLTPDDGPSELDARDAGAVVD